MSTISSCIGSYLSTVADMKTIRQLRLNLFLTQQEMAAKIGIAYSTYSKIEQGRDRVSFDTINKFAKYFKVRPDTIGKNLEETMKQRKPRRKQPARRRKCK